MPRTARQERRCCLLPQPAGRFRKAHRAHLCVGTTFGYASAASSRTEGMKMKAEKTLTEERFLTVPELAVLLRVAESTVHDWRYRGVAPRGIRVGRLLLFKESDVQAWLDEHEAR
jgi:excisionase family DNA binding protein